MSNSPIDMTTDTTTSAPRLKVWWIPQVPGKPFEILLSSFAHAKVLVDALAFYDIFQFENNIKPDYCNAGGLVIWDDSLDADEYGSKWTDWYSEDGQSIDDVTLAECIKLDYELEA